MNLELFDTLMEERPAQHLPEWRMFLEICEMYLKKHNIKNPIVVELGVRKNQQKKFYEKLLGAHHIGIDVSTRYSTPDIVGNTHDRETKKALKEKLGGKTINILFIDAGHRYNDVKKDFKMYSPLCTDIVALHDIEHWRHANSERKMVWKFWDELKEMSFTKKGKYENFLFLPIMQCHIKYGRSRRLGIGMIIKK